MHASAAFDSDAEATSFLDTGETLATVMYDANIFGSTQLDTPWQLFPFLVAPIGTTLDDFPVIGIHLAPYAKMPASAKRLSLAKYMLIVLFQLIKDYDQFTIVGFFNRCFPLVDDSFGLFQNLLSSLPSGGRKRISRLVIVGGGASARLLLQMTNASRHFWTRKLYICHDFSEYYKELRFYDGASAPPLATLLDEGILPTTFDPVKTTFAKSRAQTPVTVQDIIMPYHIGQMIYLLRSAQAIHYSGSIEATAAEIYSFVGQIQKGDPCMDTMEPGMMVLAARLIFHQMGPFLGKDSWEVVRQSLEENYEGNYEIILYFLPLIPPVNRLVIHSLLYWCSQWLLSANCVIEWESPEKFLSDMFTPLFSRPERFSPEDVPICRYASDCVLSTLENLDIVLNAMEEESQ